MGTWQGGPPSVMYYPGEPCEYCKSTCDDGLCTAAITGKPEKCDLTKAPGGPSGSGGSSGSDGSGGSGGSSGSDRSGGSDGSSESGDGEENENNSGGGKPDGR